MTPSPRKRVRRSLSKGARPPRIFEDVYGEPAPSAPIPASRRRGARARHRGSRSDPPRMWWPPQEVPDRIVDESSTTRDKRAMLGVLFGSAAPFAEKAGAFLKTENGRKFLGAGAIAAGAYFITKVF